MRDATDEPATRSTLVARVKVRPFDEDAWREFDALYRGMIIRFARRRGLTESEAEDAAQETITTLYRTLPGFAYDRKRCRFRTWLFGLATARVVDLVRRRPRETNSLEDIHPQVVDTLANAELESQWDHEWGVFLAESALQCRSKRHRIEPQTRQLLRELFVHGRTSEEIASILQRDRHAVDVVSSRWGKLLVEEARKLAKNWGD